MTGELINLRRARKAKARAAAAAAAAENRVRHGQTRGERGAQTAAADRAARLLAGAKRSDPDRGTPPDDP